MFNTFALTFRPDEIRLFIVVLAAVARSLRAMLVHDLERGRRGILSPLGRVLAGPISVARAASTSRQAATLECGWIVDGAGRLMCRWRVRRTDRS